MTLMTSLTNEYPCQFVVREQSNTAHDFMQFLIFCLNTGYYFMLFIHRYLVPGDFILVDNATVHTANYIQEELNYFLNANHLQIIYLPTYSDYKINI